MKRGEIVIRRCSICEVEKDDSDFYFQIKSSKKKGEYKYYHPECKECTKEKSVKWSKNNPEKIKATNKKTNSNPKYIKIKLDSNRKAVKAGRQKEWQQKNPDKIKRYNFNRYMHKTHDISDKEWSECKAYFNDGCAYCGLSWEQHFYINKQDLHREHVDHNGANDLSNCIPSCRECNSSKKDKEMLEWYLSKSYYNKERILRIRSWLNSDYLNYIDKCL